MKKLLILLFTFSLLGLQSVKSEEAYIGIDYLNNEIDTGITNISSTLDEKDSGYSLYAGMPMSDTMDIEVSYNDFGEASLSGVSGNQFSLDGTTYEFNATATLAVKASSIGVAAKQKVELSEGVMLYGKVGIHQWDSELSIASTTATANADEDGTDVFYGAGLELSISNLKGRIGYSLYDLDGEDIDSLNIGFIYSF
jgi:OOP family OmpA-OmpF porin|tara:strand:- start:453 stop:1043 length:591 start_codon:yes stop_codon:yes gene_type:complete